MMRNPHVTYAYNLRSYKLKNNIRSMIIECLTTPDEGPLGSCFEGFRGNIYRLCHHYRGSGGYIAGNIQVNVNLTKMVQGNMGQIFLMQNF
jgi:hypothetical protein